MRALTKPLCALLTALVTLPACSVMDSKKPVPTELRVGINNDYPPLGFEKDGKLEGIEVDFANKLGPELGKKMTLVPMPLSDTIPALEDNRIDIIMAGMSITPKRSEKVAFVEPYARVGQMALIRKEDYLKLSAENAMNWPTSRVGVKAHTTGAKFAASTLKNAVVTEYATVDEGVAALRAGKIDFFIHDAPTVWRVAGTPLHPDPELIGLYTPLTEEYLAWAVRKNDTQLSDRLDAIVKKWKADGQIKAVLDRWVPVRKVAKGAGE